MELRGVGIALVVAACSMTLTAGVAQDFQVVTWAPLPYQAVCSSAESLKEVNRLCLKQEGLDVELPNMDSVGGQQSKQNMLDALTNNQHTLEDVCSEMPKYQRVLGCIMDQAYKCMPHNYKDFLPTVRQIQMMLVDLCAQRNDIDQECIKSKTSDLYDCGLKYGQKITTSDQKELVCLAFEYSVVCQREVLPTCGYRTMTVMADITSNYLTPPVCRGFRSASASLASVGLLALAALLAHLISL